MATKILSCFCDSEFQDKEYGKYSRLCLLTAKDNTYRCTICGKEQTSGKMEKVKKVKKSKGESKE